MNTKEKNNAQREERIYFPSQRCVYTAADSPFSFLGPVRERLRELGEGLHGFNTIQLLALYEHVTDDYKRHDLPFSEQIAPAVRTIFSTLHTLHPAYTQTIAKSKDFLSQQNL